VRTARRSAFAVFLAAVIIMAARGVAYAHAMLVGSDPPADGVVSTSPGQIRLVFSEQIEPSMATIAIVRGDGRVERVPVRGDPHDVNAIVGPVPQLTPGAYRVTWRVVSADGHPVGGSYVFWIGARSATPPPPNGFDGPAMPTTWGPTIRGAPAVPALLRGLAVGCAMALTGMLLFFSWPREVAVDATAARRIMRWLAWATPLAFILNFGAWIMNVTPTHSITSEALRGAMGSGLVQIELWRLALAVLVLWALLLLRRPRVALALGLALITLSGATGHSAAIHPLQATPAKALHLVSASVWFGGLLWLLSCRYLESAVFEREAIRVSGLALWSLIAVLLSGVLMSYFFLTSPSDLLRTSYGGVLLAKIVGFIALAAFGAYHRYRVMPSLRLELGREQGFVLTLRRELAVMAIVLLLGGLLAYVPTPHPPNEQHASAAGSAE
jgi:copper transport protein